MATLKQIEAARRNGALSRGPVTDAGKARSRENAAKHGIYSKAVVLHNEDPETYTLTLDQLLLDWQPETATERRLVADIANADWRIDRLTAYETGALDFETDRMRPEIEAAFENNQVDENTCAAIAFNSILANNNTFQTIQTALRTQYRLRDRAITLLLRLQKERRTIHPEPADPNAQPKPRTQQPQQVRNFEIRRNEPDSDLPLAA